MHPLHKELLTSLGRMKGKGTLFSGQDKYLLSGHAYYDVSVPQRRLLAKNLLKEHPDLSARDVVDVADSLFNGTSYDEKTLASIILGYRASARQVVTFVQVDRWLDGLVGWAEIDTLCSGTFTAAEMFATWIAWQKFIRLLSRSGNINKRRAALVFLIYPVMKSDDARALSLSLEIVDALKHEREVIITKAVSWLLRSATRHHKEEIRTYVEKNKDSLPKIAVRETRRKIETGKKNAKK